MHITFSVGVLKRADNIKFKLINKIIYISSLMSTDDVNILFNLLLELMKAIPTNEGSQMISYSALRHRLIKLKVVGKLMAKDLAIGMYLCIRTLKK